MAYKLIFVGGMCKLNDFHAKINTRKEGFQSREGEGSAKKSPQCHPPIPLRASRKMGISMD
jgi:hypothetical protein